MQKVSRITKQDTTISCITKKDPWKTIYAIQRPMTYLTVTTSMNSTASRKSIAGYQRVYVIKIGPDGKIGHLKARLAAKGYTQI